MNDVIVVCLACPVTYMYSQSGFPPILSHKVPLQQQQQLASFGMPQSFSSHARRLFTAMAAAARNRRQPKPVKTKKFFKMDGKSVTYVAANSGTSAMVTRDGHLFMFGQDSTFRDPHTGA